MPEQPNTQRHEFEFSGGYTSKRDQLKHRIATLSVFGPVVAAAGVAILLIELASSGRSSSGPVLGPIIILVGIGMRIGAKLLRTVLDQWNRL